MFVPIGNTCPSFKEFTLIMYIAQCRPFQQPAVSVGNVGQLATDLMISTLNMPRVGYLHTDCLIPMVGSNPYAASTDNSTELCTAAEVYSLPDLKLAALQIRTPIIQTKQKQFRKLIISWIKSSGFTRSILLSSSHAYQRDDQQIHSSPLRYLLTPAMQHIVCDVLKELEWKEMEKVSMFPGISDTEQRLYIPGGGITKGLYTDCCHEDIPLAVVLTFCSEGDNIPDAFALINHLNDWLHLVASDKNESTKWRAPCSWRLLFGSGIPPALF
ncbi:hypothetical protein JZ751_026070 [Albula glossodonta]|uniref:Proteasome assembly chaperone 2 n=1 Tax=Albula glossodonta TaxID=121402 RepID=A0A8T2ND31_9TELE|nr:hypothetical protein JZ751_026070 [Albula glossodonta]